MPRIAILMLAVALAACSADRPDTVVSPKLDSGVTSNNGGGTRTLGTNPNVGTSTRVGPAQ